MVGSRVQVVGKEGVEVDVEGNCPKDGRTDVSSGGGRGTWGSDSLQEEGRDVRYHA